MGNFCILAVFERYLSNAWTDPRLILFVQHNVFRRAPSPSAVHRALGEGELKLKKWGVVLFVVRTATYHFYFSQRCQMWFNM